LKKRLDWGYYTAPQTSALGRRIPQPRGRVLGGSGSINGMLFVRGHRKNYDDWAVPGWSYENVLSSFKRMEDWEDGATDLRAAGVEVVTEDGPGTITASREVVLCAGVYGSPQLLMLSGVGPAGHLAEHGIDAVADLPVGDNLHDHMFVPMTYCMTSARNRGTTPYFAGGVIREAVRGDTWMGRTVFEAVGFVRTPQARDR